MPLQKCVPWRVSTSAVGERQLTVAANAQGGDVRRHRLEARGVAHQLGLKFVTASMRPLGSSAKVRG